jgi:hypothetical protein
MNRRSFLKMLAAATAPMFIPASNLWLPPEKKIIPAGDLFGINAEAYWSWLGEDRACIESFWRTAPTSFEGIFKAFYELPLNTPLNFPVDGSFNR